MLHHYHSGPAERVELPSSQAPRRQTHPLRMRGGPGLFLPPLSPGRPQFCVHLAAEQRRVSPRVAAAKPAGRAGNERKDPGECPWEYIA